MKAVVYEGPRQVSVKDVPAICDHEYDDTSPVAEPVNVTTSPGAGASSLAVAVASMGTAVTSARSSNPSIAFAGVD